MASRFNHVLTLVAAVLAFAPVLAVDYLLDNYVRARETAQLQKTVDELSGEVQRSASNGIAALRTILAASPSLCTPTFIANAHRAIQSSLYVRQVVVENGDGVQYCDAFGGETRFTPLSERVSIPGHNEVLSVGLWGDFPGPMLRITRELPMRNVSVFVPVLAYDPAARPAPLPGQAAIRLALTDGTPILTGGDTLAFAEGAGAGQIGATAYALDVPVRADIRIGFDVVRANYADLDVGLTIIACALAGGFLLMALQYARRARLPAFDLERAIAMGQLKPYYQPVINLRTGAVSGCEVLIRWEKDTGEIVPPSTFIDYAEVTGLAIPMTLSLMQQVKADLADLCQLMPTLKISINLFEGHFRDTAIVEDVQAIFGDSTIDYRQLVFEITERRPLDTETARSVITGFHQLGARLAMDDVGTGHSNLAYMQTLGVDVIKIDRVFVDMIKPGVTQVPVLDGLIAMARDLGTEVVAEGVETESQALYLRGRGVVLAQGYLFAPALKAPAFRELAQALGGNALPVAQGIAAAA